MTQIPDLMERADAQTQAIVALGPAVPEGATSVVNAASPPVHGRPARRVAVARAGDGPAPTLVVDLSHLGPDAPRPDAVDALRSARFEAIAKGLKVGAKTIGLLFFEADTIVLAFLQGLSADVDPSAEVCVNSAACAVTVAVQRWGMPTNGEIHVRMGSTVFDFEAAA